jgi:hypothetical protein
LQIYTPGPATSAATSLFGFAQKEHEAMTDIPGTAVMTKNLRTMSVLN